MPMLSNDANDMTVKEKKKKDDILKRALDNGTFLFRYHAFLQ